MAAPALDIGGRQIAEAFMRETVIVMTNEGVDLCFKIAGPIVVLEEDPVLKRLVLAPILPWVIG